MRLARYVIAMMALTTPITAAAQTIATHDNVAPAGRMQNGVLKLSLWAALGQWHPEGPNGLARQVAALGEEGAPLSIPAPLIRVPEGTAVQLTIRNTLAEPMRIHGLCDRPGPCEPITIAAGATRQLNFTLTQPGTFHYWATTQNLPIAARDGNDSQLGGAIIVDQRGEPARDRVFVMGLLGEESELTVINGRSWPHTERLRHATGDSVRWRIINLTVAPHAMHLHGFYFEVGSIGDGVRDTRYTEAERRLGVTEQMPPGRTMTLTWVPERAGNWLFHCHMLVHMSPPSDATRGGSATPHVHDAAAAGMAGLVLGIEVSGNVRPVLTTDRARRNLRLIIEPHTRHGATPSYQLSLVSDRPAPRLNDGAVPGPVMVLTRGEPVAIEVVNRLTAPTAIHWHGIELESYDDGVAGFGGSAGSVTPAVAAGGSFTARFTPSRAGTFIYHTHWHDATQLNGGIYGPLIVLEPGETYDPTTDHIILLGLDGPPNAEPPTEPFVVNGESKPRPLVLKAGVPNRLRFINITANNVALTVQLLAGFDPVQWSLISKDGAATPAAQRTARLARQLVSVGEVYDFEVPAMSPRDVGLWMELRRGNGELLRQWPIPVR